MLQDIYVRLLLDRVRQENYPSPEDLDRIEASVRTPAQLREYVELVVDRVTRTNRPSPAMLNRLQRLAAVQQQAVRRRARASG